MAERTVPLIVRFKLFVVMVSSTAMKHVMMEIEMSKMLVVAVNCQDAAMVSLTQESNATVLTIVQAIVLSSHFVVTA